MPKKVKKTTKRQPKKVVKLEQKEKIEGVKKIKIRVIGIGGGGGTIVSEIASRIQRASFVVANTDRQALRAASRKTLRFQFGQNLTNGLGTGMNAELGREAALSEKDKIKKTLEDQDLCILVVSLGGGAGSGAAPIFAKTSKALGNITYGIFTLPFKFEGEKKMEIARESLKKLKTHLNALSIIPNERIFQIIDKKTPLREALSAINKNLTESLEGLIEMIYEPGLINIDFADLKTILAPNHGKLAYLNTVAVQKKGSSPEEAIKKVLSSPLYPYSIRGAKGVLFNIAGEKDLELSEVNQISKTISELANTEAKIIFGISQNKKYQNIIKTTLLATGCGAKIGAQISKPKKRKKKIKKEKQKTLIPQKTTPKIKKKAKKRLRPSRRLLLTRQPTQKTKKKKPNTKKVRTSPAARTLKASPVLETKVSEKPISSPQVKPEKSEVSNPSEAKVRKNALQIKKEAEEIEEEMLEKEKAWEIPAFLRKKNK